MHKHDPLIKSQQAGLVSLLVTMLIMIVISLIVLGFAKNTRTEQRQSLDRQLHSQASYAAESGINDVAAYIKARQLANNPIEEFDNCGDTGNPNKNFIKKERGGGLNNVDGNTEYSCALINPAPPELIWQSVNIDQSVAFPFEPSAANSELNISWQDSSVVAGGYGGCSSAGVPLSGALRPQVGPGAWTCQAGALRIDMTRIPSGNFDRDDLLRDTYNFVLYPVSAGAVASFDYAALGHGSIIPVLCDAISTPRHCKIKIINVPTNDHFLRIRPIYKAANLHIAGNTGNNLENAQALVDVTGKASDILKRVQVRLSINALESDESTTIDFALQTIDTTCKMAAIVPGGSPPVLNQGPADPSCP